MPEQIFDKGDIQLANKYKQAFQLGIQKMQTKTTIRHHNNQNG